MKTSLSVSSQLRFAWPGMARGKIWPGDSDSVTLGARPGVSEFPPCENSNRPSQFLCSPTPLYVFYYKKHTLAPGFP